MASTYRLQEQITGMMLGGATLDRIEHELLDTVDISPERRAALRLYASSFVDSAGDRQGQDRSFLTSRG